MSDFDPDDTPNPLCDIMGRDENLQANLKILDKRVLNLSSNQLSFVMLKAGDVHDFTGAEMPCPGVYTLNQKDIDTFCDGYPDSPLCTVDIKPPAESENSNSNTGGPVFSNILKIKTIEEFKRDLAAFSPVTVNLSGLGDVVIESPINDFAISIPTNLDMTALPGMIGIPLEILEQDSIMHLKDTIISLIKGGTLSTEMITEILQQLPGAQLLGPLLKELPKLSGDELDFKLKDWQLPKISNLKGAKEKEKKKKSVQTLKLPEIKKIKIGPFNDIVGMILAKAQIIIEALIFQALKTSLTTVLQTIMDAASEATSEGLAGASNLKQAVEAALGSAGQTQEKLNEGINSVLSSLNAYKGGGGQKPSGTAVGEFINKVSDTLTNSEAKALLTGQASPSVIEYVGEILTTECPEIEQALNYSEEDIVNLFGGLGSVIPATIMDIFLGIPSANLPFNPNLCEDPNDLEAFDNLRSSMLANKGLTPSQIDHQLANEKARKRQKLNDLNNMLGAFPDIQLPDSLKDDPECPDEGIAAILPARDPNTEAAAQEMMGNLYDIVNLTFTDELVSRKGVLNMILSDVRGVGYKWHNEFYIKFFGQPVSSQLGLLGLFANAVDDDRKKKFMFVGEKDSALGIYPDTVAVYLQDQLKDFAPAFQSTTTAILDPNTQINTKNPDLSLRYDDWDKVTSGNNPFLSGQIQYYFNIDYSHFKVNKEGVPKPGNDFKVKITNLFDEEGFIYEGERPIAPETHDYIDSLYSTPAGGTPQDGDTMPALEYSPQATVFGKIVQSIWSPHVENNTTLTDLEEYCMTTIFNDLHNAIMRKFARKISQNGHAFSFGYNKDAIPKIKMLNDYETYGGNAKMPPFYVENPPYGGWMGIYDALLSEGNEDEERRPVIDFNDIAKKVNKFNNKIKDDPRLEGDPGSVIEPPYARILEKDAAAGIEGSILAIVRLYIIDIFIKGMPVFSLFESKSPDVFDEVLFGYIAEMIVTDIIEESQKSTWRRPRLKKETFYYKFLEQVVQNFGRKVALEVVTPTPTEEYALKKINNIMQTWQEPMGFRKNYKKSKEFEKYMAATQDYAKIILRSYVREELEEVSKLFKKTLDPSIHNLVDLVLGSPDWMIGALSDQGPRDVPTSTFDSGDLSMVADPLIRSDGYFPFVLEKYVKIERYPPDELPTNYAAPSQLLKNSPINKGDQLSVVMNLDEWEDFLAAQEAEANASSYKLRDVWKEWSFGLRISFMMPPTYNKMPDLKPGADIASKSLMYIGNQLIFPLMSVETSLDMEQPINSAIMNEYDDDLVTCLINTLINTPEYKTLFNYCFPLPSLLSLVTIYTIEGFLPSLGKEWGTWEDNGGKAGGKNLSQFKGWDKETFTKTKRVLRGMFSANYHVRDLDYLDPEIPTTLEEARKLLKVKTKLPKIKNDDNEFVTMPWWMRKMLRPQPPKGES